MDLLCLGPCDVLRGPVVVSHNLGTGGQVSVTGQSVEKIDVHTVPFVVFEEQRGMWTGVMGVVSVLHKTAYMLSDWPAHVGIFSSSILHAGSIYVAANYRRSSAAANYFESLAGALETQRHTHHFHSTY